MLNWLRHPAAAVAAAVVLVLLAVSFAGNATRTRDNSLGAVERVSVSKQLVAMPRGLAPHAAPLPAAPAVRSGSLLQIARSGKVSLYVGNLDSAIRSITGLAQRDGGDVVSMYSGSTDAGVPTAQMQIRVPAGRFDDAMDGAGGIGKIRERSIAAEDLTNDITDSDARLRNLRRTEEDIRAIMDRSGSVAQVLSAEEQLSSVREQIETLESELKQMRGRVAYATIDVSMSLEAAPAPAEPGAASQIQSAWMSALRALAGTGVAAAELTVWLVVFVPVLALGVAIVAALWMLFKRRAAVS